jgi:hypothetical protein
MEMEVAAAHRRPVSAMTRRSQGRLGRPRGCLEHFFARRRCRIAVRSATTIGSMAGRRRPPRIPSRCLDRCAGRRDEGRIARAVSAKAEPKRSGRRQGNRPRPEPHSTEVSMTSPIQEVGFRKNVPNPRPGSRQVGKIRPLGRVASGCPENRRLRPQHADLGHTVESPGWENPGPRRPSGCTAPRKPLLSLAYRGD